MGENIMKFVLTLYLFIRGTKALLLLVMGKIVLNISQNFGSESFRISENLEEMILSENESLRIMK